MGYSDNFPGVTNKLCAQLDETIEYNGVGILADIDYGGNLDHVDDHTSARATATVSVRCSDVPTPAYRDVLSFHDNTWRMLRTLNGDGQTWDLEVERDTRPTFHHR
jgi:hypothetical protein